MQVQSICSTNQNLRIKNKVSTNQNNTKLKNNFVFSTISSNTIKSNTPIKVSFKGKEITLQALQQREREINLEAIKTYYEAKGIYNIVAPEHLKEAKALYQLALYDTSKAKEDPKTHLEETIHNGEIVPHSLQKTDGLGRPLYLADFSQGKISQITEYDITGKVSNIINYDITSGNVNRYQKGIGNFDYLIEYKPSENGTQTIDEYREGCKKLSPDEKHYKTIIKFYDDTKLTYKKGVVEKDDMIEMATSSVFAFENDKTFKYQNRVEKFYHNSITRGEVINVKDRNITEWDTGYNDNSLGGKTQKARIVLNGNKIIEYDEGYEVTPTGRVRRGNYIHIKDGISNEILQALGFFN